MILYHKSLLLSAVCILSFCLSLPYMVTNILILCCTLLAFWGLIFDPKSYSFRKMSSFLLVLFAVELIGLSFTTDMNSGLSHIEKKSVFFLLPLVFSMNDLSSKHNIWKIWDFYLLGILVVILYCFFFAIYRVYSGEEAGMWGVNEFFTLKLPSAVNMSHVQFGLNVSIALLFSIHQFFCISIERQTKKLFYGASFIILSVILVLIMAKTAIIATFVAVAWILIVSKGINVSKLLIVSSIFVFFFATAIVLFPPLKSRWEQILSSKETVLVNDKRNYYSTRVTTLSCAFKIAQENFLTGIGTGDSRRFLNNCYIESGMNDFMDYDSHCQYLDYIIRLGILGIAALIFVLITPFVYSLFYNRDILQTCIFGILILCLFTENMFDISKGVLAYSFFYCFLTSSNNLNS